MQAGRNTYYIFSSFVSSKILSTIIKLRFYRTAACLVVVYKIEAMCFTLAREERGLILQVNSLILQESERERGG